MSPTFPSPSVPSPKKLAHVVMRTPRYAEMVNFYRTVFNASTAFANESLTFLTYDDEHHRFAFLNAPGLGDPPPGTAGVHHIAFTYDNIGELVVTYERLAEGGIHPVWCTNHGTTTSMYYRDPDGTQLELQVDNFETIQEIERFLTTKDFMENPIGVDFDPAVLARRFHAGEPEEALKRRTPMGPRAFDDTVKIR
ncbi:Biphenyl-2,3-diol 1,2-dioxygenase 2 [Variovorax boronicumulans]|nr:Biphenyl-2,3-diol 1,2-dioxygenase 2 [Variovorax boronicumulans]